MIERRANNAANPNKVPTWMVTFADLMALMMTFFVLLYSFSKIDETKYRSIVESMTVGFDGTQWIKRKLGADTPIGPEPGIIQPPQPPSPPPAIKKEATTAETPKQDLYQELSTLLKQEIKQDKITLVRQQGNILIRLPDRFSFESGNNELLNSFSPIISRIGHIIKNTKGRITISGHTDDLPIMTERFRSNWELSAARAVSVAHILIHNSQLDKNRITVEGHADTQPLKPNDSNYHRAINRRVEISVSSER